MNMEHPKDIEAVIDAARAHDVALAEVASTPGLLAAIAPYGWNVHVIDKRREVEASQPGPDRRHGSYVFHETDSFASYVRDQGAYAGATAVYTDVPEKLTMVAVLNGHERRTINNGVITGPQRMSSGDGEALEPIELPSVEGSAATLGTPGWGDHRARLVLRTTAEWDAWLRFCGTPEQPNWHDQLPFAEFLEDHAGEIVDPDAATVQEIARSLDIKRDVTFRQASRSTDGQVNIQWDETTQAAAGQKGELSIPDAITVGLIPVEGARAYRMQARLRYRLTSNHSVKLGFALLRPDIVLRNAWDDAVSAVATATGVPVYSGVPAEVDRG